MLDLNIAKGARRLVIDAAKTARIAEIFEV